MQEQRTARTQEHVGGAAERREVRGTHRRKKGAHHQGHAALACGMEVTEQSAGLAVATVSGTVTVGLNS